MFCDIYFIISRGRLFFIQILKDKDLHVTPLSRNINFYDINDDGRISLKEFARTLGHSPSELHVKVAFYAADRDGT